MLYRRRLQLFGLDTAQLDLAYIAQLYGKLGPLFESASAHAPAGSATLSAVAAREAYERVAGGELGEAVLIPGAAEEAAAGSVQEAASRSRLAAESRAVRV